MLYLKNSKELEALESLFRLSENANVFSSEVNPQLPWQTPDLFVGSRQNNFERIPLTPPLKKQYPTRTVPLIERLRSGTSSSLRKSSCKESPRKSVLAYRSINIRNMSTTGAPVTVPVVPKAKQNIEDEYSIFSAVRQKINQLQSQSTHNVRKPISYSRYLIQQRRNLKQPQQSRPHARP